MKGCDVSEIDTGVEASKRLPDLLLNLFANLNVYLGWYAFGNLFHLGYFAFFPNLVGNPALNSLGLRCASGFALGFAAIILLELA